ncbi:hypothetical protein D3C78_1880610 [compost metagenome]
MRWKLNTTSSASSARVGLNQAVRWKATLSRRVKVMDRPSGATVQRVASDGTSLPWRASYSTSRLNSTSALALVVVSEL